MVKKNRKGRTRKMRKISFGQKLVILGYKIV